MQGEMDSAKRRDVQMWREMLKSDKPFKRA
jgi:hypothetical protein